MSRPPSPLTTQACSITPVHLRRVQSDPPNGTSLSAALCEGLLDLMGNETTRLTSLYRTSVHGTNYSDLHDRVFATVFASRRNHLLDGVGDAGPLVVVIKKDQYVFGAFISGGIQSPDHTAGGGFYKCDGTAIFHYDMIYDGFRTYECDVWHFSLAGHFPQPTKIEGNPERQYVGLLSERWASMYIGGPGRLYLGPAADIRNCSQWTDSEYVPDGYTGERIELDGDAFLGGSYEFTADEIEVLHGSVQQQQTEGRTKSVASRTQVATAVLVGLTAFIYAAS
ncbi:unnamed protein product [Vitrella brassicaformis CCMP3155]|uniref:TLDc domain-containing protein n=1 Tax=Vitrella brassicaformis (strain CCMP3155) TaxID=1169540 RepID=A0A0G4GTF8_VITBC|nr:unnamed protein product [Vitrella brassicaformis CCMP3155]|eukprot:CEM34028.1 unnamed protein product [Vitrella brassicaformis CCMP3155]